MRNLLILLFGFVLLTAQVTLKDVVSVFGAVPDFSLIFGSRSDFIMSFT